MTKKSKAQQENASHKNIIVAGIVAIVIFAAGSFVMTKHQANDAAPVAEPTPTEQVETPAAK